jgi:hypothetical protein
MHKATFERLVNQADDATAKADELFWLPLLDEFMPGWDNEQG